MGFSTCCRPPRHSPHIRDSSAGPPEATWAFPAGGSFLYFTRAPQEHTHTGVHAGTLGSATRRAPPPAVHLPVPLARRPRPEGPPRHRHHPRLSRHRSDCAPPGGSGRPVLGLPRPPLPCRTDGSTPGQTTRCGGFLRGPAGKRPARAGRGCSWPPPHTPERTRPRTGDGGHGLTQALTLLGGDTQCQTGEGCSSFPTKR